MAPPQQRAALGAKKERAATHGIRSIMTQLPGWKGHHKFYVGLAALLAAAIWLVVALFVTAAVHLLFARPRRKS